MQKSSAFAPAHISGFFQVCDEARGPERKGSRNAGPCLSLGLRTSVEVERAPRPGVEVFIEGKRASDARTSLTAARRILSLVDEPFKVKIDHVCQVPIGAGYGASGAGALGVALALSRALGLRLGRGELISVAHVAEVTQRTGLGDVEAQAQGGLVIGLEPGPPPYGRWDKIPVPRDMKVICGTLGGLSTADLLSKGSFRERSKGLGGSALKKMMKKPTPQNFMEASREFAESFGLLDGELRSLIRAAEAAGAIGASQVMLGRAVFTLARAAKADGVRDAFLELIEPNQVMVAGIGKAGARLLM